MTVHQHQVASRRSGQIADGDQRILGHDGGNRKDRLSFRRAWVWQRADDQHGDAITLELPNLAVASRTFGNAEATRLDAMGRYVPISQLDYHMARTFARAGQADSARVYAAYVRTAWRDADPEIKKQLALLP